MTDSDVIQIVLMGLLVVVTCIYAWRTFAISNATKKQADASVKMANETKKQRYSESLPLLVPDVTQRGIGNQKLEPDEVDYQMLQTGKVLVVWWHNFGKGTAINSQFSFYPAPISGRAESFPSHRFGTLEAGGRKEVDFDKIFDRYNRETPLLGDARWHQISDAYQPRLEAEYLDIYERKITTVQKFRIDEQAQRAFLGELYFTLNGRRFGEEE